jgi:hypothetical protein
MARKPMSASEKKAFADRMASARSKGGKKTAKAGGSKKIAARGK